MASGTIYILVNPAFRDLLKIGKTTRTSKERAAEISAGTGVPTKYFVACDDWTQDCDIAEKIIHTRLANHRYGPDREFFELELKEAITVVSQVIEEVNTQLDSSDKKPSPKKINYAKTKSPRSVKPFDVKPSANQFADMTQILPPRPLAILPNKKRKVYFSKGEHEITDKHLRWYNILCDFRWVASAQVCEGKYSFVLVLKMLRNGTTTFERINTPDEQTAVEMYKLLTEAP